MPGKMARSDPRPSVRVTRGAGSGQHLASVLQEGRQNANIDAGLGFIWRISAKSFEVILAGFALSALLIAQWMLSYAIHGTNYDGGDGKMAQAIILAAVKFSGFFQVTTISPIEGIGSQLLPLNVWANPAYWPFHFLDKAAATHGSGLIALAVFSPCCFVVAICLGLSWTC